MFLNKFTDFLSKNKATVIFIFIFVLCICLAIGLILFLYSKEEKKFTNKQRTKKITSIAIFSAFSSILYFLKFPLAMIVPFIPSFLEIQFSNVPVLIGGFTMGPLAGIFIVLIRTIIKLPFTSTFCVGELADLIIGISVVLVSTLVYNKNKRTLSRGVLALLLTAITWIVVASVFNYFVFAPIFIQIIGKTEFINMCNVIPGISDNNYMLKYILIGIVPFNGILSFMVNTVTFVVYKRISHLFKKSLDIQ